MTTISFSASLKPALRGKQLVALFASKAALKRGAWKHVFDGKSAAVLKTMIKDASPGVLGRVVSSYTGGTAPARVALAVLPDAVSRHASPARGCWRPPRFSCSQTSASGRLEAECDSR